MEIARDGVLRIQLQCGIEGRCRIVELTELEKAAREPGPGSLIGGREARDFFVDAAGFNAEVAAFRELYGPLFERGELVHD